LFSADQATKHSRDITPISDPTVLVHPRSLGTHLGLMLASIAEKRRVSCNAVPPITKASRGGIQLDHPLKSLDNIIWDVYLEDK
jgi:hypothetical protein